MRFEWDENKRLSNLAKHGLDFSKVGPLFENDGRLLTAEGLRGIYGESRFIGFGRLRNEVVAICFTTRSEVIRIISLRKANSREKKKYEQKIKAQNLW